MNNQQPLATLKFILCNQLLADGNRQKRLVEGRVYINSHGIETQDGLREHFDDPECAIMNYALEHYDFWRTRYPTQADAFALPGIFGENFATTGLTEQTICIGDIYQMGNAVVQVSWGRVACNTMATRLDDAQAPDLMHQQSRNGWFYRVLQTGEVQAGTTITLIERPHADWTLSRVQNIIFNPNALATDLEAVSKIEQLAAIWKNEAVERLNKMP